MKKQNIYNALKGILALCFILLIVIFALSLTGCKAAEKGFVENKSGEIEPNPAVGKFFDAVGNTLQNFGVPYAGLAGEFWGLIATGAALWLNQKRRQEKKMTQAVITGVEMAADVEIKEAIQITASQLGVEPVLHERVKQLTTNS